MLKYYGHRRKKGGRDRERMEEHLRGDGDREVNNTEKEYTPEALPKSAWSSA